LAEERRRQKNRRQHYPTFTRVAASGRSSPNARW
jgi:hypothetical protein